MTGPPAPVLPVGLACDYTTRNPVGWIRPSGLIAGSMPGGRRSSWSASRPDRVDGLVPALLHLDVHVVANG